VACGHCTLHTACASAPRAGVACGMRGREAGPRRCRMQRMQHLFRSGAAPRLAQREAPPDLRTCMSTCRDGHSSSTPLVVGPLVPRCACEGLLLWRCGHGQIRVQSGYAPARAVRQVSNQCMAMLLKAIRPFFLPFSVILMHLDTAASPHESGMANQRVRCMPQRVPCTPQRVPCTPHGAAWWPQVCVVRRGVKKYSVSVRAPLQSRCDRMASCSGQA
jgi:hypothetical protein